MNEARDILRIAKGLLTDAVRPSPTRKGFALGIKFDNSNGELDDVKRAMQSAERELREMVDRVRLWARENDTKAIPGPISCELSLGHMGVDISFNPRLTKEQLDEMWEWY